MSATTVYHCDRCKRETDASELNLVIIESESYHEIRPGTRKRVDLCEACLGMTWLAVLAMLEQDGAYVQLPDPAEEKT